MGKRNSGLTVLNALLAVETYMTNTGHFVFDGSQDTVITGIMRKSYSPYVFDVYWNTTTKDSVPKRHTALITFDTDGNIDSFTKNFG